MTAQQFGAWALALTLILFSSTAYAENVDLTRLKVFDWSAKERGGEWRSHVIFTPTDNGKELSDLLKKQYGIRLSTDDPEHHAVISAGRMPRNTTLSITSIQIDRFRKLVEFKAQLTVPESASPNLKSTKTGAPKEQELDKEDLVVEPKSSEEKAEQAVKVVPKALVDGDWGNPALLLPLGKLDAGVWWLRVDWEMKQGGNSVHKDPESVSFSVKDLRPSNQKPRKSSSDVGLERPDSKNVLDGLGSN